MTKRTGDARWQAAGAAALLLLSGGAMGVLVDRLWLSPPAVHATPLTAEAMAARLDLSIAEEARVRTLLDSLHTEIVAVVEQGPDALRSAARDAHHRIEAALPPGARAEFRVWMQEQHQQLLGRMHGGMEDHALMHEGRPERQP